MTKRDVRAQARSLSRFCELSRDSSERCVSAVHFVPAVYSLDVPEQSSDSLSHRRTRTRIDSSVPELPLSERSDRPSSFSATRRRLSYMFGGPHLEMTVFRGWAPALARTCESIHELVPNRALYFQWVQIVEEQGAAHLIYFLQGRSHYALEVGRETRCAQVVTSPVAEIQALSRQIDPIVVDAERVMSESCLVCGRTTESNLHFGRRLPLCGLHQPQSLNVHGEEGLEGLWRTAIEWCAPRPKAWRVPHL